MLPTLIIQQKIFVIRGEQVMLDYDLAGLYGIETRILNQAVKRNIKRFPPDFMFQLTKEEWDNLKSQIVISSWGGTRKLPYAFTEQGVAMLSGVLNSDIAIEMNIAIMRTFVAVRRLVASPARLLACRTHREAGARRAGTEDIHGRGLHRPKRHQRRHPHTAGTHQPSPGRAASRQAARRAAPPQPHRLQNLLITHR